MAKQIATRITILRRDYLNSLIGEKAGIYNSLNIDRISKRTNIFENRAYIDGKILYIVIGLQKNMDMMNEYIR